MGVVTVLLLVACHQKKPLDEVEITQIAKEAYIYGFPVVELYRDMYIHVIDKDNSRFLASFNKLAWRAVSSPVRGCTKEIASDSREQTFRIDDTEKAQPESGMAYGSVWFDLRDEPYVLTVPATMAGRYFSIQFIDLFSEPFECISNRRDGNNGGHFLIATSEWKGKNPSGMTRIITSSTSFVSGLFRIRIENQEDVGQVEKLIRQFRIIPLSQYNGTATGSPAGDIHYPEFSAEKTMTPEFFTYLNFLLQFCSISGDENEMMRRFARIGIEPGRPFDHSTMSEPEKRALIDGMAAGQAELKMLARSGVGKSVVFRETGEDTEKNYSYRAYMSARNPFGGSSREILTLVYETVEQNVLDGRNRYELRFDANQLPPVDAFWTLTAYPFVKRPSFKPDDAYVLNSASRILELNNDGSLVVTLQQEEPGQEKRSNWLPVPSGPFYVLLQLYQPREDVNAGYWLPPEMNRQFSQNIKHVTNQPIRFPDMSSTDAASALPVRKINCLQNHEGFTFEFLKCLFAGCFCQSDQTAG